MNSRKIIPIIIMVILNWSWEFAREDAISRLSKKEKVKLVELYLKDYPFLTHSPDWKHAPETTNHFFTTPIYRKLQGNFIKGWEYNEGFVLVEKNIHLLPLKGVGDSKNHIDEMNIFLKKKLIQKGIKILADSNTQLSLCLVGAVPEISRQSLPGVIIEMCIKNKKSHKAYLFRFATGKKSGLSDALIDAADIITAKCLFFHPDNIQRIRDHVAKNVK